MNQTNIQSQFQKLRHRRELLVILLFLFVIVVFWIAISIFSSQSTTGISADQQKMAAPLSPAIDVSVIQKLEQKQIYSSSELNDFPVYAPEAAGAGNTVQLEGENQQSDSVVLPEDLENTLQSIEEGF